MKLVSLKRFSSKLVASVLSLGMAASLVTAMAVNIRSYHITEGTTSVDVLCLSDDPEWILRAGGYAPDEYEILSEAMRGDELVGLHIGRKFPVTIEVDGQAHTVQTAAKTVGALFLQEGLHIGASDIVTPHAGTVVSEGLTVSVTRVDRGTITEDEPIPFEIETKRTNTLSYGHSRMVREGTEGVLRRTYDVTYHNGIETSRTLLHEEVAAEPVHAVREIGTAGAVTTRGGDLMRYKQILNVEATAYSTEGWSAENKKTKIGTTARVGAVAVDPEVIPLGSRLYITSADGADWVYGLAVAEDTGSAIKGNRIDLYFNTQEECVKFGRKPAKVYILA